MSYKIEMACCGKPVESLFQSVQVTGTAWKEVNVDFDDETGEYAYEVSPYSEDFQKEDEVDLDYECIYCLQTFFTIDKAINVIELDTENYDPQGRYLCDYCDWRGNFIEDHEETGCEHRPTGPINV